MVVFLYIVRCSDKSLYIGVANNLQARENRHNRGEGALYTKRRMPVRIVYSESFFSRKEAMVREKQLKGWSRLKKENLIEYGHPTKF